MRPKQAEVRHIISPHIAYRAVMELLLNDPATHAKWRSIGDEIPSVFPRRRWLQTVRDLYWMEGHQIEADPWDSFQTDVDESEWPWDLAAEIADLCLYGESKHWAATGSNKAARKSAALAAPQPMVRLA